MISKSLGWTPSWRNSAKPVHASPGKRNSISIDCVNGCGRLKTGMLRGSRLHIVSLSPRRLSEDELLLAKDETMTREEILSGLTRRKPDLQRRFRVKSLALFGSFARGDQEGGSDVDILVDIDPPSDWIS